MGHGKLGRQSDGLGSTPRAGTTEESACVPFSHRLRLVRGGSLSPANLALLKLSLEAHEGFRASVYLDSRGFQTIGIGRLVDGKAGGGISKSEALHLLDNDLERVQKELTESLAWWLTLDDVRQRALIELCFNMGIGNLLQFRKALAAMEQANWHAASAEILDSAYAGQVGKRAYRLAAMVKLGVDVG